MARQCFAPNELLNDSNKARDFGIRIAEPAIQDDYLSNVARTRAMLFPSEPGKDWFDNNVGMANYDQYINFLKRHHLRDIPDQNVWLAYHASVREREGLVRVPDIITYDVQLRLPRRIEFYEIKPNSESGRSEGESKIAFIHAMLRDLGFRAGPNSALFHFGYNPGVQYSPDKEQKIFSRPIFGIDADMTLHFWRPSPGLILYEVCADSNQLQSVLAAIIAILLLILYRLITRGVPLPGPRPGPGPVPGPAIA